MFALAIVLLALTSYCQENVTMMIFVESKCPFCAAFQSKTLPGIMDKIGSIINFIPQWSVHYDPSKKLHFWSQHGDSEVIGDYLEVCTYMDFQDKYLDFLYCAEKDYNKIPNNMEDCANSAGVDWDTIHDCVNTQPAITALWASENNTQAHGVQYVPTIFINDKEEDFDTTDEWIKYICDQYTGTPPPGCS